MKPHKLREALYGAVVKHSIVKHEREGTKTILKTSISEAFYMPGINTVILICKEFTPFSVY
jgi:hypothetical protein